MSHLMEVLAKVVVTLLLLLLLFGNVMPTMKKMMTVVMQDHEMVIEVKVLSCLETCWS
jgi:hypothetical protein